MRRLLTLLGIYAFVAGSFLGPAPALAQGPPQIERLDLSFWPEFDQAAVLVIYRAELAASTQLPTTVRVPIPADVGDPFAVARLGPDGNLLNANYTRTVEESRAWIAVETDSLVIWVEFYTDLTIENDLRRFEFAWPGGMTVAQGSFEVQQPASAEDLQITPAPETQRVGDDGLLYFSAPLESIAAGTGPLISFNYRNPSGSLSADLFQSAPALGRPEPTFGDTPELARLTPWLIAGALALVLGAGGYLVMSRRRAPVRRPRRRRRAKPESVDPATAFCHNCGTPAGVSDRFCRNCGTPLRR